MMIAAQSDETATFRKNYNSDLDMTNVLLNNITWGKCMIVISKGVECWSYNTGPRGQHEQNMTKYMFSDSEKCETL